MNLPSFPGWELIGQFPEGDPDGVGSWLLHHDREAALLEVPPGLSVQHVKKVLSQTQTKLRCIVASHEHEDHYDTPAWNALMRAFPLCWHLGPSTVYRDLQLSIDGEPLWLLHAPKHSLFDVVTVFRGVAMTGDIELGTLDSVNDEVPELTKWKTMKRLREFQERTGYHVHSTISAHLNDVRTGVDWKSLFSVERIPHEVTS